MNVNSKSGSQVHTLKSEAAKTFQSGYKEVVERK